MIYCTLNWLHMTNIGLSSSSGGLWGSLKCTAVKFTDDCTNMIIAEDECQIESEMMKPMIVYRRKCQGEFMVGRSRLDVTQSESDLPDFNQSEH